MNCSEALKLLDAVVSSPRSLPNSIGDQLLYQSNPLFRRVRDLAVRADFKFELNGHVEYFASPVMGLDRILSSKTIPYRDNLSAFREFCGVYPNLPLACLSNGHEPRHSHVLHESAHCLGDWHFYTPNGDLDLERKAFIAVLVEAIAQATDLMVNFFANDQLHYWCLVINHNWQLEQDLRENLVHLVNQYGFRQVFRPIIYFMLFANYHRTFISDREWKRILSFLGFMKFKNDNDEKKLRRFLGSALDMDPLFRYEATRNYFCGNGTIDAYQRVLQKEPLEVLEKLDLRSGLEGFLDLICEKLPMSRIVSPGPNERCDVST